MKQLIIFLITIWSLSINAQTDSIPLISDKTCEAEIFCTDSVNCGVLPIKLTCDAKSRSKNLPLLVYTYKIDWDSDGVIDLTGSKQSITLDSSNGLKLGKHKIIWEVKDINNLHNSCEKTFEVKDCSKPKIFAKKIYYNNLINGECFKSFKVKDLVDSTYDNCTNKDNLRFKIIRGFFHDFELDEILMLEDSVYLYVNDSGSNYTIFVIDESNNWSYTNIITYLTNTPNYFCLVEQSTSNIFGKCLTILDEPILNTEMFVNQKFRGLNGDLGNFRFILELGAYSLKPQKNNDIRNGVTTADLVAINKHILNIDTFAHPHLHLAADINRDFKISTADLIALRKVILFINDTFPNNNSWRFYPKTFNINQKEPEKLVIKDSIKIILNKIINVDFIGLKVGDLNGSAKPNSLITAEERSIITKKINIQNIDLQGNKPFELKLPIAELFDQDGFQLSLRLDPALVELVSLSGIDADSYHFDEQTGALLIAFVKGFSKGNELVLNLLPKTNCSLLQALSFPESKMKQEFYTQNQSFSYSFEWVNPQFELYQAQPNPFSTSTVLRFFSPKVTSINFNIYNSNGQLLKHQKMTCKDGINEVEVAGNELIGTGVYHCQFKTELGIFNQKIVFIQ